MWTSTAFCLQVLLSSTLIYSSQVKQLNSSLTTEIERECRAKCGGNSTDQCSCDVRCRITGNCCEDLPLKCPEIFLESFSVFQNFVELLQECIIDFNMYLLVSGCPNSANSTHSSVSGDSYVTKEHSSFSLGVFDRLLKQVPVTDLASGFTFKNISIYRCNNFLDDKMEFWDIYFDLFELEKDGMFPHDTLSKIDFVFYPPLALENTLKKAQCHINFLRPEVEIPKSTYRAIFASSFLNGYERLCDSCVNKNNTTVTDSIKPTFKKLYTEFPIVARFENHHLIFEPVDHNSLILEWSYLNCTASEAEVIEPGKPVIKCSSPLCNTMFNQRPDGQCKLMYTLQVAVPDDGIPMTSTFLEQLPGFLACYLSQVARLDVENKWRISETSYNGGFGKLFFVTQLLLFSTSEIDFDKFPDTASVYFSFFADAIYLLRRYRRTIHIPDVNITGEKNLIQHFQYKNLAQLNVYSSIFESPSYVQNTSLIPVCAAALFRWHLENPPFLDMTLKCAYVSSLSETLSAKESLQAHNATCLRMFTFPVNSVNKISTSSAVYLLLSLCLFF
ncbi:hypothetical protein BgiBS90_027748 [Biomphalaria glabrata]|nr:hypothetical protein BgiBS90_027748 [Biomphalaria glabrata]